jgi:hypothetical protein
MGNILSPTTKGNETINNLFTLITKEDVTLDHTKGQAPKGKRSFFIKMRNKIKT